MTEMTSAIEMATGMELPKGRDIRHVVIVGTTATGRTTMAGRIAGCLDANVSVGAILQQGEEEGFRERCRRMVVVPRNGQISDVIVRQGMADGDDVLVVGDVCTQNGLTILRGIFRMDGRTTEPSIITCHYDDMTDTRRNSFLIALERSPQSRGGIAIVRMAYDRRAGTRHVESIRVV